ncbi:hypothetical protein ABEV34_07480 [Methylorubrum rhodesianum]|uniref:hypothetical protein n=1 Tax=Methylorubrum rhodesianum TaxID=29427 RepID=UPI003D29F100
MAEAIGRAHGVALDALSRALWMAHAAGEMTDGEATTLAEAIAARRKPAGGQGTQPAPLPRKPVQRPPVRSVAVERRRRLAASGPMPPALAARFTTGELAALRIIADEHQARGSCALCIDAIAARAGVSRTTAQNAIRQAVRLGMMERQERRRPGMSSLTNLLRIVDREWLAWLSRGSKGGGLKKPSTTDTKVSLGGGQGKAVTASAVKSGWLQRDSASTSRRRHSKN